MPPHGTFRCGASSHRPAARQDGLASRVPDRGETHFKTALSLEGVVTVQRNLAKRGQLGALPASDNYTNFDVGCEVSAAAKEALAVGERGAESTRPAIVLSAQAAAAAEKSAVAVAELPAPGAGHLERTSARVEARRSTGDLGPAGDMPVAGEASRRG